MSEPTPLAQVDFVRVCQRLLAAIQAAPSAEARESAEADFEHFLKIAGAGRLQEWARVTRGDV